MVAATYRNFQDFRGLSRIIRGLKFSKVLNYSEFIAMCANSKRFQVSQIPSLTTPRWSSAWSRVVTRSPPLLKAKRRSWSFFRIVFLSVKTTLVNVMDFYNFAVASGTIFCGLPRPWSLLFVLSGWEIPDARFPLFAQMFVRPRFFFLLFIDVVSWI